MTDAAMMIVQTVEGVVVRPINLNKRGASWWRRNVDGSWSRAVDGGYWNATHFLVVPRDVVRLVVEWSER